jgi:hypothetical protein
MRGALRWMVIAAGALACGACTPMRSKIDPPYRIDGREYSAPEIRTLALQRCTAAGAATPTYPFTTDGCSAWRDGAWRECCIEHDLEYWCGATRDRRATDRKFRQCVAEASSAGNGRFMYSFVRLGGAWWWPFRWRWGYGYSWPRRPPP